MVNLVVTVGVTFKGEGVVATDGVGVANGIVFESGAGLAGLIFRRFLWPMRTGGRDTVKTGGGFL